VKNIAPVLDSTLFLPTTRKKGGGHNDVNVTNLKSLAKTLCFGGCRPVGKPTGRQDGAFWRDTSRAEEEKAHILQYVLFLNKLILQSDNTLIL